MVDLIGITPEQEEKLDGIIARVMKEIEDALWKHGPLPDDHFVNLAIIGEEYGEACEAALHRRWAVLEWKKQFAEYNRRNTGKGMMPPFKDPDGLQLLIQKYAGDLHGELIQVAAMAISMLMHQEM